MDKKIVFLLVVIVVLLLVTSFIYCNVDDRIRIEDSITTFKKQCSCNQA
jgi:hypothetical protein